MIDVTERRMTETELIEAKRFAEDASRAKDDFIAALSHELRTPLTPVLMIARTLVDDPEITPDVRAQMHMLLQNAEMEVRLIDDLLDVNRFTHGKFSIRPETVSIHDVLRNALDTVQELIAEKALQVHTNIENSLLIADPIRLQQVFCNLLKNAIKFTPEHGHIHVRSFNPEPNKVTVEVRDTGVGIAPEILAKIFVPFEQGAAAGKPQFGGLGLGLAISKAIVESHDGTITAASAGPGYGATFTVSLPRGAIEEKSERKPVSESITHAASLRILLVEDNGDIRVLLTRCLERDHHRVHAVGSCRDAISAIENSRLEPFQALISDLELPDGSGAEAARKIKASDPSIRAVALSGHGNDEDVQRSIRSGFDAHLTKPIDMEELRKALAIRKRAA